MEQIGQQLIVTCFLRYVKQIKLHAIMYMFWGEAGWVYNNTHPCTHPEKSLLHFKSRTHRRLKPFALLLSLRFTLPLLLFMFRFQAFVDEFSVADHQLPLLPMLLKLPLVLRLPPGRAEITSSH